VNSNIRDAIVSMPQPRDRLENRRDENNEMSRRMWKTVETSTREVRMGKAEGRRSKERSRKEMRRKGQEKETKKGKMMEVKKVVEEWEIWDEEEEAARLEAEAKKLVPEKFYKWIKVFGKKQSEKILMKKMWDHEIEVKERFVPRYQEQKKWT